MTRIRNALGVALLACLAVTAAAPLAADLIPLLLVLIAIAVVFSTLLSWRFRR